MEGLIKPFLQNVNCTVVSANIHPDQTLDAKLSGYYKPYVILSVGSEKVAVVGYTTAESPFLSMPGMRISSRCFFYGTAACKLIQSDLNRPELLEHMRFSISPCRG